MPQWCHNRFEITGKSVCVDVLTQWITGSDAPGYRHAIQQSIRLFLAGNAGVLKPTCTGACPLFPGLVSHGTGASTVANLAYEQWLGLLLKDAVLDTETVRLTERLYHQSGLGALKWENIPTPSREVMGELFTRQGAEWFGMATFSDAPDPALCWERLGLYQERSQPCDMLAVIPTRLAAELNGNGGLLAGASTTESLYIRQYGVAWPSGHDVTWQRPGPNGLTLRFDTPWVPPCGEVIGEISAIFDCEVRHHYEEPVSGIRGYDCYDLGEHVDGHKGQPAALSGQILSLFGNDGKVDAGSPAAAPAKLPDVSSLNVYREVRG
ncbi:DUF1281 domain-containing protein [Erwinia psidii]|uniref:DUF1281 domain-containing protein n=1 Tax=Erwinia psidii TaxID=69224 RepID=UPI00226BB579|nr:DUF1281 domain-containing protein [Erwinia psidii]MCX8959122.1 DUF1281 domain-containing protein [Erwinia psidii]